MFSQIDQIFITIKQLALWCCEYALSRLGFAPDWLLQSIFPEVELDKIKRNIGFDVTIVTSATNNEDAKLLLAELGMPFSDRVKKAA